MAELRPDLLVKEIQNYVSNAWRAVTNIEHESYRLEGINDYESEGYELANLELESYIKRIYIALIALYEFLGYQTLLRQLRRDYAEVTKDGLTNLVMLPAVGELDSEVLRVLHRHFSVLSKLLGTEVDVSEHNKEIEHLERILLNTPKIVYDRELDPKNEKEVRKVVYDLLVHVFPSTVREIPICQVTKTYKPDIGVKSLKTAIEYKFADSEEEVKKAIGGLYEDMRGYAGSEDWTQFYAVVYMTDAFFTQDQIMAEFCHTDADKNWKPILVQGKGARRKADA